MNADELKQTLLGAFEDAHIDDFRKNFLEQVKANALTTGDFEQSAFVDEAVRQLEEAQEICNFVPCFYEDPALSNRLKPRIDGYAFDEVDGSVRLVVADYHGDLLTPTLNRAEVERSFKMLRTFVQQAIDGKLHTVLEESSPAYCLASDLYLRKEHLTRLRMYLVTDAEIRINKKDWPEEDCNNIPVEFHLWDIQRFQRVCESLCGQDELKIDFTEYLPNGVPCLAASQSTNSCKSFLCVIPGNVLADIYDRFGSRLLEGNVRSFLSARGKVNKGIQTTIKKEPEMFFAFNNGISATCTDAEIGDSNHGLRLVNANYLQIVNGGQTTASLFAAKRAGEKLDELFVQMKLTLIVPEQADTIVPRIAYCANSQNKVSDADFFSNHPFHVRIETISRRLWAPAMRGAQHETHWFYERARGQYLNAQTKLTGPQKKVFLGQNPRAQLFSKTDLAKYENSWNCMPHLVSQGGQKNFMVFAKQISEQWQQSEINFNEEYFREAVAKSILFRSTERIVSAQPWYQGGYRAQTVTYAIAKLADMIKNKVSGRCFDFRAIWSRQGLSPVAEQQIAEIAGHVYDILISADAKVQNVGEWCKREVCWEHVRESSFNLHKNFVDELTNTEQARSQNVEARNLQKVDAGIESQILVMSLGDDFWNKLQTWGKKNMLLTDVDARLLSAARRGVPSEKQCIQLLALRARLRKEGFEDS